MEIIGDEPTKKSKSIALKSKGKSAKALQALESNEETLEGDFDNGSDVEEMVFLTKRLCYMNRKKKRFYGRRNGVKGSSNKEKKDEPKARFNYKKHGRSIVDYPGIQKESSNKENFKSRVKKCLMVTWEDLDVEYDEEEVHLAMMEETSYDTDSDVDAEDDDELFFELTREKLITVVKDLISNYQSK